MANKQAIALQLYKTHNGFRVWLGKQHYGQWASQVHLRFGEKETTLCGIDMRPQSGKWWSDLYDDDELLEEQISCKRCLKITRKRYGA